jgi:exopolyphosphatase/guanosine-5'-triphosphate,3'-diphosphate pyrophosphatase
VAGKHQSDGAWPPDGDADHSGTQSPRAARAYAALDLGTNNCRLLVARPSRRGFKVIDAFSRIIRLGEGVSATGRLSEPAIERTIEALKVCAAKLRRHDVVRAGLIATEACRVAANSAEFLERAHTETGLDIKIVDRETEARLAVSGCASLIDQSCDLALVFDIGGGSSELIWLDLTRRTQPWRRPLAERLEARPSAALRARARAARPARRQARAPARHVRHGDDDCRGPPRPAAL